MNVNSAAIALHPGDALVLVDVQNDFLPGGSLAVPAGDQILEPINRWLARFAAARLPVFATRDWHPPEHCSFAARGGPWPPHCVAGTRGAEFAPGLKRPGGAPLTIIDKGTDPDADAYSGFQGTDLHTRLQAAAARRLYVGGLATDYCVLNTVIDACRLGYDVVLLESAIRPVEVHSGDGARATAQMIEAGARVLKE
jgi:nicotinamidase/pyrazinamidase